MVATCFSRSAWYTGSAHSDPATGLAWPPCPQATRNSLIPAGPCIGKKCQQLSVAHGLLPLPRHIQPIQLPRHHRRHRMRASSSIDCPPSDSPSTSPQLDVVVQSSSPSDSKERRANSRERPRHAAYPARIPKQKNKLFHTVISNYSDRMMGSMLTIVLARFHTRHHAQRLGLVLDAPHRIAKGTYLST